MPASVRMRRDGDVLRIEADVPIGGEVTEAMLTEAPRGGDYVCAPDYASVLWRGERYTFTRKQRLVVAALLQARAEGTDYMSQESLLDLAESDQQRLRELFRSHPAWGVMIVPGHECGGPMGTYRLAP